MLYAVDFRKIARDALNGKWPLAVLTGFVAALLGGVAYGGGGGGGRSNRGSGSYRGVLNSLLDLWDTGLGRAIILFFIGFASILLIWGIITFIIGGAIELGYCRFNKNLIKGTNPQFQDIFSDMNLFGKALGLRIVTTVLIILWSLLFIIPGIIAAFRYSMAFYIMDDDPGIGIMEAIERSKVMMNGNKGRLFCLEFSFIGWAILSILTCGIGFLFLQPYTQAAVAAFYLEISGQRMMPQTEPVYDQPMN
jgi:uncharacterized membrane protein